MHEKIKEIQIGWKNSVENVPPETLGDVSIDHLVGTQIKTQQGRKLYILPDRIREFNSDSPHDFVDHFAGETFQFTAKDDKDKETVFTYILKK